MKKYLQKYENGIMTSDLAIIFINANIYQKEIAYKKVIVCDAKSGKNDRNGRENEIFMGVKGKRRA